MNALRLPRSLARIVSVVGVAATVLMAFTVAPASAATAPLSTANAANVTGVLTLTTGACNAPSLGTDVCGTPTPGSQLAALLSAGVLTQIAGQTAAPADYACAGLSGPGGALVQIGPSGECPKIDAATGVSLLGGTVRADAVYAECHGSTTGITHAFSTLNLAVGAGSAGLLGGLLGEGTLSLVPTGASSFHLVLTPSLVGAVLLGSAPIALLSLNTDVVGTPTVSGAQTFTALELSVLPGLPTVAGLVPAISTLLTSLGLTGLTTSSLVTVQVGVVTCSPVAVATTDVIPPAGAPIAAAMLLIAGYIGWRFWWVPRQRATTV